MKELTDPSSKSYVPFPYPDNRPDIIADMRYYVDTEVIGSRVRRSLSAADSILKNLFSSNPDYKIGRIIKVKNRVAAFADDYTWLVFIMDPKGNIVLRFTLMATGQMAGYSAITDGHMLTASPKLRQVFERYRKSKRDDEIKSLLSEALGRSTAGDLKRIDRVTYLSTLGELTDPLWEIQMRDGTVYYYSINRDAVYCVKGKVAWRKDERGLREPRRWLVRGFDCLPDTINDELIVLEEMHR